MQATVFSHDQDTGAVVVTDAGVSHEVAAEVVAASGLRFVRAGTSKVVPGSQGRDVLDDYDRNTELVIAYVAPGKGKGHSAYPPSRSQAVGVGGAFYTNATTKVRGAAWHQIV